jgi:RNA-directed DNA polymerase
MVEAWKRVKANKGSAGVDGLSIEQTYEHLKTQWPQIRSELLRGVYRPQAVRRVEIPKPAGGVRELGIPTVTDRLIQQALLQVLQRRTTPPKPLAMGGLLPDFLIADSSLRNSRTQK